MKIVKKKNSLIPTRYDEVSLVDVGAADDAVVLIMKNDATMGKKKGGRAMPTIIEKRKGMMTCADCGAEMAAGAKMCPECGSMDIKKSLIIIRKETPDDGDEEIVDEEEEFDEDEDEEEEDDSEDDLDADDEDEDEEEDDDEPLPVKKTLKGDSKKIAFVEALNLSTALSESVTKILSGDISKASSAYEDVMTEFNTIFDTAFDQWVSGTTVSKSDSLDAQATLIKNRVSTIIKEGGADMPKKTKIVRPESLDELELSDEVTAYIAALESDEIVEKSGEEDIYKGLTPKAAEIVKKAAETNERSEVQKFVDIAKSFTHIPGDKTELAKSLRLASETSPEVYKNLTETLTAANENLSQSDVFKSFGRAGGGGGDAVSKNHTKAEELVSKGTYATIEEAEVSLMGGADYTPTTVSN